MASLAIELRNITKTFPNAVANKNVNLGVIEGEIHAVIGENGAGKTTLMNILYGLLQPDKGQIYIWGHRIKTENPHTAIKHGIGMVHQHFMLIKRFTVLENIILGNEPVIGPFINIKKGRDKILHLSKKYGFNIDPDKKISDLSVGVQQKVEILKVLYRGAKILVLDEPTAVLTPLEVEELFEILRKLRSEGHTIIFITHKLKEVISLADRVTVIRKGKTVGVKEITETDQEELSSMMVGRTVMLQVHREYIKRGAILLKMRDVSYSNSKGVQLLNKISLDVFKSEIVGIAGVEGNGQSELLEVVWGIRKLTSGVMYFGSEEISHLNPRDRANLGISYIPDDRHKHGLILDYSLKENLILGQHMQNEFSTTFKLRHKNIHINSENLIDEYDIRPPFGEISVRTMSGGNQQKVIIAREINRYPQLILASNPTRGLDVGVIENIYKKLLQEKKLGKGILLVSSELSEILSLSDRILVMYKGKIIGETTPEKTDEKKLGLMMSGIKLDQDDA